MKISRRHLRQIIKEERAQVLKEYRSGGTGGPVHDELENILINVLEKMSPGTLEQISRTHTGSELDDAARSLAKIALDRLRSRS